MKLLTILLALLFFVPPIPTEPLYDGTVLHFFTHALIARPSLAFEEGNEYGVHLDEDCVTPKEFSSFLEQAYLNGYALVDIEDTFRMEGEKAVRKSFPFPKDKKPLVLSFDDLVYAKKNLGKGMADKLVLEDNQIGTITTEPTPKIDFDSEGVSILEGFIKEHPDFSYRGARGVFFLTGNEGIFGYRTQAESLNRKSEIERVKPIVEKLKQLGWKFGCHSYSHGHMKRMTEEGMREDLTRWKAEVQPLVGSTVLYAYPYGEWVLGENCSDPRHQVLEEFGFRVFFGVGTKPFYTEMPLKSERKVLFMDRAPLDGISFRSRRARYLPVFDCRLAYDELRPIPFPSE